MAEKEYIERDFVLRPLAEAMQLPFLDIGDAWGIVENAPAADVVEVRHGTWIADDDCGDIVLSCSLCDEHYWTSAEEAEKHKPNYCPNCGARMDGGSK